MTWIFEAFWDGERGSSPSPRAVVAALTGKPHVAKVAVLGKDMVRMELEGWARAGQAAMDGSMILQQAFPDLELEELAVRMSCLS